MGSRSQICIDENGGLRLVACPQKLGARPRLDDAPLEMELEIARVVDVGEDRGRGEGSPSIASATSLKASRGSRGIATRYGAAANATTSSITSAAAARMVGLRGSRPSAAAAPVAARTNSGTRRKLKKRGAACVLVTQNARIVATTGATSVSAGRPCAKQRARSQDDREQRHERQGGEIGVEVVVAQEREGGHQRLIECCRDDPSGRELDGVLLLRAVEDVVDVGGVPRCDRGDRNAKSDRELRAGDSAARSTAPITRNATVKCGSVQAPTTPPTQSATIVHVCPMRSSSSAATTTTLMARKAIP